MIYILPYVFFQYESILFEAIVLKDVVAIFYLRVGLAREKGLPLLLALWRRREKIGEKTGEERATPLSMSRRNG